MSEQKRVGRGGARSGAGRPAVKGDGQKYTFYLSGAASALIDALAGALGKSRSEAVETAVEEAAKARKIKTQK